MFESYSLDNFFQVFPTTQRVPLFTGSEASFLSFPNDDRNIVATLYSKPSQGAADDDSFSTKISDGLLFLCVFWGALTKLFGC